MKRFYLIFFLFSFLVLPVQAEYVDLPDADGATEFIVGNDATIWSGIFDLGHVSTGEDVFITSSDDVLKKVDFQIHVSALDLEDYQIPVETEVDGLTRTFYINIDKVDGVLNSVNVSVLDENQEVIDSDTSLLVYSYNYLVTIDDESINIHKASPLTNVASSSVNVSSGYFPADMLTVDLSAYPEGITCRLTVLDDYELEKSYDSFIMKIYWVITKVVPDPHNSLYVYFQLADAYFTVVTWLLLIFISVPFFYVFIAGVCGMAVCVLKGTFQGGLAAGFSTFITIIKWPVQVVKIIWDCIIRVVEVLYPF